MSSEVLTLTLTKRKGADDRIRLQTECTRGGHEEDHDYDEDGIPYDSRRFDVEEDRRRIEADPVFQELMAEIKEKVAKLICMQLH